MCVLLKRKNESDDPAVLDRLCCRGHGGGVCLEPACPRYGTGGGDGPVGVSPCGDRLLAGRPVPAGSGQDDSPSAPEQHAAGRSSYPAETDHHAGTDRHPPQHPRGDGGGRGAGGLDGRKRRYHRRRYAGPVHRHRPSEFPGGGDHLHAVTGGGNGKRPGISVWRSLRHRGAFGGGADPARSALSTQFRGGGHDLCSGGGVDPGGVRRGTLQSGDAVLRGRIYHHAGAGCGAGVGDYGYAKTCGLLHTGYTDCGSHLWLVALVLWWALSIWSIIVCLAGNSRNVPSYIVSRIDRCAARNTGRSNCLGASWLETISAGNGFESREREKRDTVSIGRRIPGRAVFGLADRQIGAADYLLPMGILPVSDCTLGGIHLSGVASLAGGKRRCSYLGDLVAAGSAVCLYAHADANG